MRRWLFGLAPLVLVGVSSMGATGRRGGSGLVVHEWGTFLAMAGSDGVTLDGMYHEEHALPPFVHARSKDQLRMRSISLKGETPVIYFYTEQQQDVNVRVRFPRGIWTQWYPQASMVAPGLAANQPDQPAHGHICWNVQVVPPGHAELNEALPPTNSDALWNFARRVDAAFVRSGGDEGQRARETERFIFYRGLGRADLPLSVSSLDGGTLKLDRLFAGELKHLFVIRVESGTAAYRYIPSLSSGESRRGVIPSLDGSTDLASFSQKIGRDLAGRLEQSGLYRKEAEAMVNTWRKSYFESDGVRVLFVLPQPWTDRFIPMNVHPKPTQLVRVMVGRTELLTPEREASAQAAVKNLFSEDGAVREKAFSFLRSQGRYVEPILNRVISGTKDKKLQGACRALKLADFVSELRTSTTNAADGSKIEERPAEVHAQLASLLREIGQGEQASDEAARAEQELARIPPPEMRSSDSRWYLRAYARMKEGLGDDGGATQYYERLVRFGSQSKTCRGCHIAAGPQNMAFYRDWWAGRKYAEITNRLGRREESMRVQKEALARNPADTAAQMLLAYLTDSAGDKKATSELWARIEGRRDAIATRQ